jgi:hypothetical protein
LLKAVNFRTFAIAVVILESPKGDEGSSSRHA